MAKKKRIKKIIETVKVHKESAMLSSGIILVVLASASILFFFWKWALILVLQLVVLVGSLILIARFFSGRDTIKSLYRQKRSIEEELKLAEKQYLKREISEKDFRGINEKKQIQLVKISAKIRRMQAKEVAKELSSGESFEEFAPKKKHLLKKMAEEKKDLMRERKLIETKYQKRLISSESFLELLRQNKSQEIEVDAGIQEIYSEELIRRTMMELKQSIKEMEKETSKLKREETSKMAEDIHDMLRFSKEDS